MGQYWIPVNLDKHEFIHPHKLGTGLKLWEHLANHPGTGAALVILCAAMPERRGGGDLSIESDVARKTIGRWAGDRIAFVGDYAERGDLSQELDADLIYYLCYDEEERANAIKHWREQMSADKELQATADRLEKAKPYTDITDDVCAVIEAELEGEFVGSGWRKFKRNAA